MIPLVNQYLCQTETLKFVTINGSIKNLITEQEETWRKCKSSWRERYTILLSLSEKKKIEPDKAEAGSGSLVWATKTEFTC